MIDEESSFIVLVERGLNRGGGGSSGCVKGLILLALSTSKLADLVL